MSSLILQPTITAEWQALIKEAEENSHLMLSEELESYLVFLLVRFSAQPEIAHSILALEFLHGMEKGHEQMSRLRDVGDKCLIYAGLFPEQAEQKRVRISYFIDLGCSAYSALADLNKEKLADLYNALVKGFVSLTDVLHSTRELAGANHKLTPLQAESLWNDVKSPHALEILRSYTKAMPIWDEVLSKQKH